MSFDDIDVDSWGFGSNADDNAGSKAGSNTSSNAGSNAEKDLEDKGGEDASSNTSSNAKGKNKQKDRRSVISRGSGSPATIAPSAATIPVPAIVWLIQNALSNYKSGKNVKNRTKNENIILVMEWLDMVVPDWRRLENIVITVTKIEERNENDE